MDMYGGDPMGGGIMPGGTSASRSSPTLKIVLVCVACLIVLGIVYFAFVRSSTKPTSRPRTTQVFASPIITSAPAATQATSDIIINEEITVEAPDIKVGVFAFESMTMPGYVPTIDASLANKTAAMPPFKFVACGDSGYAIRWNGKYLTLDQDRVAYWHEEKLEPDSCFKVVPGYCGTTKYIMLRSGANNSFLRYDPSSKKLVCVDAPTGRTSSKFCWKLEPDPVVVKQPCGCQYSYELGRVVCTPCDGVKEMPDTLNGSCSTVTAGYQATCCIRKGAASQSDAFCNTVAWPEVVGRTLQEAMLYIRTRRPDLTLVPCSAPCTAEAYPTQSPNTVVIPYDPRSGLVVAAARRLI